MPLPASSTSIDALDALIDVSVRVGSDPLLVQGGGGNASVKSDDTLSVKASGFWLRDARETPMFVDLDLAEARRLANAGAATYQAAVRHPPGGQQPLRPSIETGLHALMPHRFVLHVHGVNAITTSAAPSLQGRFAAALAGLRWTLIDYVTPGPDLAAALNAAQAETPSDVVILRNHGLVVGAETALQAEAALHEVERRLDLPRAGLQRAVAPDAAPPPGYRWLDDDLAHGLARDPVRATLLCHGALVPDQVVYLGGAACLIERLEDLPPLAARWTAERGVAPGLVFVADQGALVREDLTSGGLSMIGLLCEIALRLPAGERPTTLSLHEELVLLNWEAEKFRQAVDRNRV